MIVTAILFPHPPAHAQNGGNIVDRLDKALGVKLPKAYQEKLDSFLANNRIMQEEGSAKFTADFIEKQMQSDW